MHKFSYVIQNSFQVIWKGFTCQCMSIKNTVGRNDVRCLFYHQCCTTWLITEFRMGVVCAKGANVISWEIITLKGITHFSEHPMLRYTSLDFRASRTFHSVHPHVHIESNQTKFDMSVDASSWRLTLALLSRVSSANCSKHHGTLLKNFYQDSSFTLFHKPIPP